jgi:hypothetical protein
MQMGALLPESPVSKYQNFKKFLASKSRSLGSQHFIEQLAAKKESATTPTAPRPHQVTGEW